MGSIAQLAKPIKLLLCDREGKSDPQVRGRPMQLLTDFAQIGHGACVPTSLIDQGTYLPGSPGCCSSHFPFQSPIAQASPSPCPSSPSYDHSASTHRSPSEWNDHRRRRSQWDPSCSRVSICRHFLPSIPFFRRRGCSSPAGKGSRARRSLRPTLSTAAWLVPLTEALYKHVLLLPLLVSFILSPCHKHHCPFPRERTGCAASPLGGLVQTGN
jgi:hypothetical protein